MGCLGQLVSTATEIQPFINGYFNVIQFQYFNKHLFIQAIQALYLFIRHNQYDQAFL